MNKLLLCTLLLALCPLLLIAQTTETQPVALSAEIGPNELQQSDPLQDMGSEQPYQSPVRYDSAGLDSFIRATMASAHIPGAATWTSKNGQVIWQQCYGYAILEDSIKVADTTSFLLGSISKTLVGTAIMQLWERNLFDLDDNINDYLPFDVRNPHYPDSAITFEMLMTHTSSMCDNWTVLNPLWQPGDPTIPLGEFLHEYLTPEGTYYTMDNFNDSVPGAYYDYCNVAVALLGYLVEVIEDSFPIHCQDSIFKPLGMNHTSWFLAGLDTSNIAVGYHWDGAYEPYPHIGIPFYPAGLLRASMVDIAQHLTAIMQNGIIDTVRILDSATVDLMLSPHFVVSPTSFIMGLIWRYAYVYAVRWIWYHPGAGPGVSTIYGFCPAESSAVIVLTNGESYDAGTLPIADALFDYAQQYGIEEHESSRPIAVTLQISPNPFTHSTQIRYEIDDREHEIKNTTLTIYDATGRLAKIFSVPPAYSLVPTSISWDGTDGRGQKLASGVYFLMFEAGGYKATEKLILLK